MNPIICYDVPRFGLLVYIDERPVCVGFLRRCEGNYAFIDGLTTNPRILGDLRHVAIDALVVELKKKALEFGVRHLLAWSVDEGTLKRSQRHGFAKMPDTLIAASLIDDNDTERGA